MDAPDWLGVPGSSRYLGLITIPLDHTNAASLDIYPMPYDGCVLAIPDSNNPGASGALQTTLVCVTTGAHVGAYAVNLATIPSVPTFAFPVSAAMGAQWRVSMLNLGNRDPGSAEYYLFAQPNYPIVAVANNTVPIPVTWNPVVGLLPGNALPVAPAAPTSKLYAMSALGALGTVTFPATSGRTYQLAGAHFAALGAALGDSIHVYAMVRDGASGSGALLWADPIVVPAVGYQRDRVDCIVPLSGTSGNAMTVEFSAAADAVIETVVASVWY